MASISPFHLSSQLSLQSSSSIRNRPPDHRIGHSGIYGIYDTHSGEIGPGSYKILVLLEGWPESEQRPVLSALVEKWRRFPAAWERLSLVLNDDISRLAAIERGLMYEPDDETKGALLLNKALALDRQGKKSDAVKILGSLALDPQSTMNSEITAKFALRHILRGK